MATIRRADRSGRRIRCKLCGAALLRLPMHLQKNHGISGADYQQRFPGAPLMSPDVAGDTRSRKGARCRRCEGSGCHRGCTEPCDHLCPDCGGTGEFYWSQDAVITAIRRHARNHRGKPPTLRGWQGAESGRPETATVQRLFGSWNKAIAAAGFAPRNRGMQPGARRRVKRKKFCRRGLHRMTGRNVYVRPNGARLCRACAREAQRQRWSERKDFYLRNRASTTA